LLAFSARPGGNITGMLQYEAGIAGKWLAMLKEIAPSLGRVILLANPKTTAFNYFQHSAELLAPSLAIELVTSHIETPDRHRERNCCFRGAAEWRPASAPDSTTILHRDLVVALAAHYRLPSVYAIRVFVAAGRLMSYGTDQVEIFRQAASYVDRILRGAKAADLPVQAPTKYGTTLNLKTAKALGLDVPSSLLVRADEVIE
jgi:putative ABC transport system substrate-binding protein